MSQKRKSASSSAVQMKNRSKTIGIEEKLRVRMRREKDERIFNICSNVWLAYSSVRTIRNTADRSKESATSGTKVFVYVAKLPQSYPNDPY
jgi:hypothetical protein